MVSNKSRTDGMFSNKKHLFSEPVSVVSITGPYREGKSYIIGEVFGQRDVFPIGHEMDPETMGIWMWIVPHVYKVLTFSFEHFLS